MIHQRDTASRVRDLYEDGHDPAFGLVVDILQPVSEVELAEAIEADGRLRLALGRSVDLDRYLAAEQLEAKPVALDAAIEVALRAASRASAPDQRDVDYLVSRYPKLQRPIREAAMLAQALRSTTSIRRRLTHDHPARRLPADFGPRLADGRARYELLELLGEGASGAVYRAVDRHLSDDGAAATVAIKVFAPGADPALADWMRGEALKARRVTHENVVRALDRGETDEGESYIVYEFVDGGDLGSYVRARGLPLPARQAARLLSQVARGVQAVHAAGLVHCDLKPGNIAMTRDGAPKVADFGIAMREGQQPRAELGAPGAPLGNLAFISPEQFRGDPGAYSFPSDIYALGGMLAYFVTGELPNGATAEAIRTSHRAPRPVDPPARLDRDLRRIIVRATDPDPARRHASASELADDLDRFAQRRPLQWGRTGIGRRARLFARRRPVLTALALLALGGVATAAGVKIREDVRRVDVGDFISVVMEGYVNDDSGGENLPMLIVWENFADFAYFDGRPIAVKLDHVDLLRKLMAATEISEQPGSFDHLIVRTALAMALVSRRADYIEAEPMARACAARWAELFGPDDPMVARLRLVEAAAGVNRLVALHERGDEVDAGELARLRAILASHEQTLPARDVEGPVPKMVRIHLARLDKLQSDLELVLGP